MLCHYKRVITKHKEFVYRTKCYYYNPSNSKKRRGVRSCVTGEGKKKRNERNSYLDKKHMLFENFDIGDYWGTLTYKFPITPQEAEAIIRKVMAKTQKKLKRKGIPFVRFITTEASDTVRPHHHLIIRNTSPEIIGIILDYWKEYGNIKDIKQIYNMENGRLVKYFLEGDHKDMTYKTFSHSRNLRKPEVITRVFPVASFRENPKPPKCNEEGYRYEVVKESVKNWFPDIDGFTYQEYELVKVKEEISENDESTNPRSDRKRGAASSFSVLQC